jgi:competence protein ComEC
VATGNNRSCVVKIDDGEHSVLLTGDIEAQAELAMLSRHWRDLASTLIQVPHHGSNTSSSLPWYSVRMGTLRWHQLRVTTRGDFRQ